MPRAAPTQAIVVGTPPNYAQILARFPQADRPGVIFSYGDKIFNPSNANIPREIMEHEAIHGERQTERGIDAWWEQYMADALFCLDEEIHAHHAEYRACVKRHGHRNQDMRRIATRLSGALYGYLLTYEQAKHAILTGEVK